MVDLTEYLTVAQASSHGLAKSSNNPPPLFTSRQAIVYRKFTEKKMYNSPHIIALGIISK